MTRHRTPIIHNYESIRALKERAWSMQLQKEHESICYSYNLKLAKPHMLITHADSFWGQYNHRTCSISINSRLIEEYSWSSVIEILKHEIAHQMVFTFYDAQDHTHGEQFQDACEKISVAPWARKGAGPIIDHRARLRNNAVKNENPIIRKLNALLKLGSSQNEFEAQLALQKAEDLCRKYNLKVSENLHDEAFSFKIINHKKKRIPQHQSVIAHLLSEYFLIDCIFSSEYDAQTASSYKTLELIGSQHNLDIAEYVYFFLWDHLPRMWNTFKALNNSHHSAKNAFYGGILDGFEQKLSEQAKLHSTAIIKKGREETLALELIKKKVSAYTQKRYPKTRSRRVRSGYYDSHTYNQGVQQGRDLTIHAGLNTKSSQQEKKKFLPL